MSTKTNGRTQTELARYAIGALREYFHDRYDYPEQTHGWLRDNVETVSANLASQSARIAELEESVRVVTYLRDCHHARIAELEAALDLAAQRFSNASIHMATPRDGGVMMDYSADARALLAKKEG